MLVLGYAILNLSRTHAVLSAQEAGFVDDVARRRVATHGI